MPDMPEIQRLFGINLNGRIRKILFTNLYSVLNMQEELLDVDTDSYDIVINTHGDLLPFYEKHNDNDVAIKAKKAKINLTYCHYPLLPYQIKNGMYKTFLGKYINDMSCLEVDKFSANANTQYTLMMNGNIILTNSAFSAKAIKQIYHNVHPIILSPPVDIDKFRKAKLPYSSPYDKKQNIVLVVSRFSADKEIENAITLAKLLKDECLRGKIQETKMIIAGNSSELNYRYVRFLEKMILDYRLQNRVKLVFGASFDRLLDLMKRSKVYFHPLAGEPFGISVAADIISNVLNEINDDKYNTLVRSFDISNRVSIFSIQSYKKNLKNIIDDVVKSREAGAVIVNTTQTRISEAKEI
jgi:glycosyltransferase involved in cell wall biosynthesis